MIGCRASSAAKSAIDRQQHVYEVGRRKSWRTATKAAASPGCKRQRSQRSTIKGPENGRRGWWARAREDGEKQRRSGGRPAGVTVCARQTTRPTFLTANDGPTRPRRSPPRLQTDDAGALQASLSLSLSLSSSSPPSSCATHPDRSNIQIDDARRR